MTIDRDPEVPEADAQEQERDWAGGGESREHARDPDVPEADAQEQDRDWGSAPGSRDSVMTDPDVPEADAQEQATPVDDEDDRRP